jgi:hypothetical protein
MAEQEAKVVFSESGSESVVGAFKNVGAEAGKASSSVGSAGSAIKEVGGGMKSAASNIAQTATAFATLAISVVNTWRSYRDLGDAQLAVDKANLRVTKTTQAVAAAQKLVNQIKASAGKTDLKAVANASALALRETNLKKAVKDGSKTRLEAKKEQDAINLARSKQGTDKAALLAKAEQDLKNKTEQLGLVTESAAQKQKHFNDSQQDFYLSLLPTAISTIATTVSGFESLKNVFAGGGGLIGSLSGIGLILGGASIALLAYQNNWLGFKDVVGGVIDWVKERFGVWKDTIAQVFNLIKSGDWKGAFDLIRLAALKFWEDLKKSVPFFGAISTLINSIAHGQWDMAFGQIKQAAIKFWDEMKIAVPLLADVETIITDISEAKWGDAFQAIVDVAVKIFNDTFGKGIAFLFGDNWKLGLDAWLVLQEMEAKTKKRSLILQYAITINAAITELTGIDIMKWFKDHPITGAIPFFGGITMMVDDPKFRGSVAEGTLLIIKAIGEGLTRIAGLMDPYIAGLFVEKNWTDAVESTKQSFINAGKDIWKHIFDGIGQGLTDQNWLELFGKIPLNIQEWTKKTMPETFKTSRQAATAGPFQQAREKLGVEINPIVPGNIWAEWGFQAQKALGLIHPTITPQVNDDPVKAWTTTTLPQTMTNAKAVVTPTANNTKMKATLKTDLDKVMRGHYPIPFDANMSAAEKKWQAFAKKVQMTTLQVKIAGTAVNIKKGSQRGAYGPSAQGGMHQTLSRDTLIQAHKGEQVDIDHPAKQARKIGNGNTNIRVFIGNTELKQLIHYTVNEDQGISK